MEKEKSWRNSENRLKEKFEKLIYRVAPQENLREEVFESLDQIDHIGSMLNFFTLEFSKSEILLMDSLTRKEADLED